MHSRCLMNFQLLHTPFLVNEQRLNFDTRATIRLICWDAIYNLINFEEKKPERILFSAINRFFRFRAGFLAT